MTVFHLALSRGHRTQVSHSSQKKGGKNKYLGKAKKGKKRVRSGRAEGNVGVIDRGGDVVFPDIRRK